MLHTSKWQYCTRILPFISICCLLTLLAVSFNSKDSARTNDNEDDGNTHHWQSMLACYIVLLHVLATISPARMFYATGKMIEGIQDPVSSVLSTVSGPTELTKEEQDELLSPRPLFVIIIPSYKEHMSTLEETLRVLASHPMAPKCYHIYLAMEEREQGSIGKATALRSLFQQCFYRIDYCVHPYGLPKEVPGKASNENWAFMEVCNIYPENMKRDIIVTTMDADTHLSWRYFEQIRQSHVSLDENAIGKVIYMPPLVFDRNLHQVPLLVRLADIMWAGAGISSMYPRSRVCIPTSVYSIPMPLIELVGGWDVDSGAIGEDLHMYIKCLFALSGQLTSKVVLAAASQCNVASSHHGFQGYIDCMGARYQQALRHMWGALDTGYAIRRLCHMLYQKRRSRTEENEEGQNKDCEPRPIIVDKQKVLTLFHRLYEAHFLPTHLVLTVITSSYYTAKHSTTDLSHGLQLALEISSWLRTAGFCLMICYFYRYQQYHRLCVRLRQDEMSAAGLLKPLTKNDGFSGNTFVYVGLFEALLFPVAGLIYGAVAALQAVVSHIFTDRLTEALAIRYRTARSAAVGSIIDLSLLFSIVVDRFQQKRAYESK